MAEKTKVPAPTARKSHGYPEPLIIHPSLEHKQSFIILHGRGSNAEEFGPALLGTQISPTQLFSEAFPHVKFIFPTASKRRAKIYNRSIINQWFDNGSLQTPTEHEELQIDGLRETSAYIHKLLKAEIELLGAENVVLGGLSQGCAASLISLLTWQEEPLAAAFGMCGWLPFRKQMEEIARSESKENHAEPDDDDPFDRSGDSEQMETPAQAAVYLYEELGVPIDRPSMSFQETPLFLGHGTEDQKVPLHLGQEAASCLISMGLNVIWKEYDGLAHWYSPAMLCDLVDFLRIKIKEN
ncbi:phospholipase/carboxylesterase, partial [Lecanoromycetidae sp. Uapishka_2]